MSHVNDSKKSALLTLLSESDGNIVDLEKTWLLSVVVSPAGNHINDLWQQLFIENGATSSNWNNAAAEFLISLGYSGAISDMWSQYWAAGGDGVSLVFHALTFDPVTFEVLGVKTGTGDLTEACTSTRYQSDHENVWRGFGSGVPAYKGGRVVENLCKFSDDLVDNPGIGWALSNATWSSPVLTFNTAFANAKCRTMGGFSIGDVLVASVVLSGSGTLALAIQDDTGIIAGLTVITLSSTPTRYSILRTVTASTTFTTFNIDRNNGSATEVTVEGVQVENATGQTNQAPGEYIPTTTAAVRKVFANENGNSVASNVVTEAVGAVLSDPPWLYGAKASTNSQIRSFNIADAEFTKSNMTAVLDAVGMRGDASGATTCTATAGNATAIANAITDASDDQLTRWFIKRKTGTGVIEITVDGGSTWQDVTTEVDSTAGFNECLEDQAALANPQIGIRIVTDTDAVYVGNAAAILGSLAGEGRKSSPAFTAASSVTINATDDSFDDADFPSQGGYFVEWQPQYATAEVSGDIEIISLDNAAGLLYYDATNSLLKSTDGTNTASVALTVVAGTTYKIWVAYGDTSLQVGFDSTTGTAGTFDGAFDTGTKIELVTPSIATNYTRNMRAYSQPFAAAVITLQALAA